jgi:hypothetical protein
MSLLDLDLDLQPLTFAESSRNRLLVSAAAVRLADCFPSLFRRASMLGRLLMMEELEKKEKVSKCFSTSREAIWARLVSPANPQKD